MSWTSSALATGYIPSIVQLLLLSDEEGRPTIAAGQDHACAVLQDRTVWCWGKNGAGQLGNNSTDNSDEPVQAIGVANATGIYVGYDSSCATIAGGSVMCWGENSNSKYALVESNDLLVAQTIPALENALSFSMFQSHMCQVRPDKTVQCAGDNFDGELGDGTQIDSDVFITNSVTNAVSVSAGRDFNCALIEGGTVKCWGINHDGQTGIGDDDPSRVLSPMDVVGLSNVVEIDVGDQFGCARLDDQTIKCWGGNGDGQVGIGMSSQEEFIPQTVQGISTATAITVNHDTACALLEDKTIRCWGDNQFGQAGNQDQALSDVLVPTQVLSINDVSEVALGHEFGCAVSGSNEKRLDCWGTNDDGQLANESFALAPAPLLTSNISKTVSKIATGSDHSCALYSDGTIDCWGRNVAGELGIGNLNHSVLPTPVTGISTATDISAGSFKTCAVLSDGTIKCWGRDASILAGGGTEGSTSPVSIPGISTAIQVGVGVSHNCALLSENMETSVACWGNNNSGQLGNGSNTASDTPVGVSGLFTATSIAVGANHSCAILLDGTMQCWGNGFRGQLGNGAGENSNVPVTVSTLTNATAMALEGLYTCAIEDADEVYCWGIGFSGQLGTDGTSSDSPVKVSGISNATAIGVAIGSSCAATDDGMTQEVRCWGGNERGQLGIDDLSIRETATPSKVVNLDSIDQITSYSGHYCTLEKPSTIACWGDNQFGSIGNGTRGFSIVPLQVDLDL